MKSASKSASQVQIGTAASCSGSDRTDDVRAMRLETFSAGMGHDIRNAVMPLLLHLDLLEMHANAVPSAESPADPETVSRIVENLQRLANGLLLRATENADAMPPSAIHLDRWWRDVGDMLRAPLPRGCALDVRLPAALPAVVAQPAVLAQVLLHLMVNLRLALPVCTACVVQVTARRTPRGVSITIRDGATRTPPVGMGHDTGLAPQWGMSLARSLLARHGGDLAGYSLPGHGTQVTLRLVVASDALVASSTMSPVRPIRRQLPPTQGRTVPLAPRAATPIVPVLMIDDNAALTGALCLRLAMDGGFTCLPPMHELHDSLARITALAPRIVLLDLNLPGEEQPLDVIRGLRATGRPIDVVILTGNPSMAAVEATRAAGAAGFIAKGVSPERLLAALRRVGDGEFVLELD